MIFLKKYVKIFEYFRQCPQLSNLWSIAAVEDIGKKVILPQGASQRFSYREKIDVNGDYHCDIIPIPSVYEDFQINCYEWYDAKDGNEPARNENVLSLEEVESVCRWVEEMNDSKDFPDFGENVVSIECIPAVPQIRYVNPDENTVGYFITVRIRYINRAERKHIWQKLS